MLILNSVLYILVQILFIVLLLPVWPIYLASLMVSGILLLFNFNVAVIFSFFSLAVICLIFSRRYKADLLAPSRIFSAVWFTIISIGNIKIGAFGGVWSEYLWFTVLLSVLGFYVGAFIPGYIKPGIWADNVKKALTYTWNKQRFNVLISALFLLSLVTLLIEFYSAKVVPVFGSLFGMELATARSAIAINSFVHRLALLLINVSLLSGFYLMLFRKDKARNKMLALFIAVASFFCVSLIGGRYFMGIIVVTIAVAYNYLVKRYTKKAMFLTGGAIFLVVVTLMAFFRDAVPSSFLEEIGFPSNLIWLAPGFFPIIWNFSFLDETISSVGQDIPFNFGWQLVQPIRVFLGFKVRGIEGLSVEQVTGSTWAAGTYLAPFYMDFGLFGVFCLPFLIGFAMEWIYRNMQIRPTIFKIFLYSYFVWNIIYSFYDNSFILFDFWFGILLFYLIDLLLREHAVSKSSVYNGENRKIVSSKEQDS